MHSKIIQLFFLGLFVSCTSLGNYIDSKIKDYGFAPTIYNQNYSTLKEEGYFFIMGYVNIIYNEIDITENCSVKFNSNNGPGILLDRTGALIIPTLKMDNSLFQIWCARKEGSPFLNYTFYDAKIMIRKKNSYFGKMVFHFSNVKNIDKYSKYNNVGPWIKKINYNNDEKLKNKIESISKITSDEDIIIKFNNI